MTEQQQKANEMTTPEGALNENNTLPNGFTISEEDIR
jgi:hypothetical protein